MPKDNKVYLLHILDAISQIEKYTGSMDYGAFMQNMLVQDGVIRQLEIIGEATKRLTPDFRLRHSVIPWKDVAGMRDKLIHYYLGVDIDAVWDTVKKDLPLLKEYTKKLLDEGL